MPDRVEAGRDRRRYVRLAAIAFVYAIACRVMLAPIFNFGHPATSTYAGDVRLIVWTLAWDNHAILSGVRALFDANIFYPARLTLAYSEPLILQGALAIPAVWLGVTSANRDPRVFPNPDDFVPERQPNPHLAFAAGAHRCLGAHLARKELVIALEEWHQRIPHYRLAPHEPLMERGGQLTLLELPLAWD